jgi:hypothetical protein
MRGFLLKNINFTRRAEQIYTHTRIDDVASEASKELRLIWKVSRDDFMWAEFNNKQKNFSLLFEVRQITVCCEMSSEWCSVWRIKEREKTDKFGRMRSKLLQPFKCINDDCRFSFFSPFSQSMNNHESNNVKEEENCI